MLPIYIIEAIEEAGFPLPQLEEPRRPSKQARYDDIERDYDYE